ncbi:hypothetical protein GQ457_09G004430 [Hibiscus cannabinus]
MWDHRLVFATNFRNYNLQDNEMLELGKGNEGCDIALADVKLDRGSNQGELNGNTNHSDMIHQKPDTSELRNRLSDTLDAAWTGEIQRAVVLSKNISSFLSDSASLDGTFGDAVKEGLDLEVHSAEKIEPKVSPVLSTRSSENMEDAVSWLKMPFLTSTTAFAGGFNDTVIPVYDDEPTSLISYALASPEYHFQVSNDGDRPKKMRINSLHVIT